MPDNIEIISANYGTAQFEDFLRFPWSVQKTDPCWIPPILSEQRYFLNPAKSWFFEIGEAELFLAKRGGQYVGRISAQTNRLHDERYKDDTGFFGFFECVDDQEVANALFETAAAWLRGRGRKRIVGPLSLSIYDEVGLLVEGFDTIPAILQTHNPPYYATLTENFGFRKAIDWLALWLPNPGDLSKVPQNMEARMKSILDKQGLKLEIPKPIDVIRRKHEVFELFNEAWGGNWGHLPFTEEQFKHIMNNLRPLLRSDHGQERRNRGLYHHHRGFKRHNRQAGRQSEPLRQAQALLRGQIQTLEQGQDRALGGQKGIPAQDAASRPDSQHLSGTAPLLQDLQRLRLLADSRDLGLLHQCAQQFRGKKIQDFSRLRTRDLTGILNKR